MSKNYHLNALPPGTMLHEYEVLRVLGEGSFGIVYLTKGRYLDDLMAIKEYLPSELATRIDGTTVTPTSSGNEQFFQWGRQKFLEEARLLRQLATPQPHPNIVAVRRFFELHGTAYLVMDYEEGEPLSDLLARQERLPEAQVRTLLEALLDGLGTVHAAGITHRDVKPSNIFLRTDGSPVLLDFGAARVALGEKTRSSFSALSPAYAAAEQLSSSDSVGPWTDIYGLGATLFRAVTGQFPQAAVERLVEDAQLRAAELAAGDYSSELLRAIDAALALRAEDRPQSVAQWRSLFEVTVESATEEPTVIQHGRGAGQLLGPARGPEEKGKSRLEPKGGRRKRPVLVASIAAGLLVAVGATFGAYYLPGELRGPEPDRALAEGALSGAQDSGSEALRLAAEEAERARLAEAARLKAEEAERARLAEAARLKAEEAERARLAEAARLKAEEAERARLAEAARLEAEEAERARLAEAARLEAEEAERARLAEAARLEAEEAERAQLAEAARLKAEEAERARLAEAARLEAEEAERARLAEAERRRAEEDEKRVQEAKLREEAREAEILRGKTEIEAFIRQNERVAASDFRNFMIDEQVMDVKARFRRVIEFGKVEFLDPDYSITVYYGYCVRENAACRNTSETARFLVSLEAGKLTFREP